MEDIWDERKKGKGSITYISYEGQQKIEMGLMKPLFDAEGDIIGFIQDLTE